MKKKISCFLVLNLLITGLVGINLSTGYAKSEEKKYVVLFKETSRLPQEYTSLIEQAGGKVEQSLEKISAVEVSTSNPDFAKKITSSDLVEDAGIESIIYPEEGVISQEFIPMPKEGKHDLFEQFQWDIKQVTNDGGSWELDSGTGKPKNGQDIIVGIIDTGIDYTHPDLKGNYLYGKSFIPEITDPIDERGHGTHVAGTIAAKGRVMGVGPDLKIASYRVFGPTGGTSFSNIANAIVTAGEDKVDVINLSAGGYSWLKDPEGNKKDIKAEVKLLDRAIDHAIKQGAIVVGSAGNEGLDISNPKELTHKLYGLDAKGKTVRIPNNKKIIRVAATTKQKVHADYSNYGKGMIDVSAPGGDSSDFCLSTGLNGGYSWRVGTSMAAPKVAALAGIIIAKHGKGNITPKKVNKIIERSAIDIETPGYDANSGYGLINVSNALH